MNKPEVTIAVDGSLFRYHPRLQMIMEETLKGLINPSNKVNIIQKDISMSLFFHFLTEFYFKFEIVLSTDGSGRGAAVVAAVAAQNDPSLEKI
jgi:hexokinase